MSDPRWTPKTEDIVARALLGKLGTKNDLVAAIPYAERVLAALADAGLLIAPEAKP